MKSLEMAKKSKEFIKAYRIKLITEINQDEKVYGFNNIGAKDELKEVIDVLCWYDKLEQDLEVLEILRKHLRFMGENKTSLKLVNNGCVSNDLVKVKQWLEENENDR